MSKPWTILHGDVRKICKTLPDNHFDAVLCDPPYGLKFMGRRWDYSVPSAMVWNEVERVMKPGAQAMVFGGTKTFHRLVCNVEDGGFIPIDLLMWCYGSGFPKSLDISKAIDEELGNVRERETVRARNPKSICSGKGVVGGDRPGLERARANGGLTVTAGRDRVAPVAKMWSGYGTNLKPSYEPILLARKYIDGTFAANALEWGCGGLDIIGNRLGGVEPFNAPAGNNGRTPASNAPVNVSGYEGQTVVGRWPTNLVLTHDSECRSIGRRKSNEKAVHTVSTGEPISKNVAMGGPNYGPSVVGSSHRPDEEVFECVEGCPVRMMDEQSGNRKGMSGGGKHRDGYEGGMFGGIDSDATARGDAGGASRFFKITKWTEDDARSEEEMIFRHAKAIVDRCLRNDASAVASGSTPSKEVVDSVLRAVVTEASQGAARFVGLTNLSMSVTQKESRTLYERTTAMILSFANGAWRALLHARDSLIRSLANAAASLEHSGITTITMSPSSSDGSVVVVTFESMSKNAARGVPGSVNRMFYNAKADVYQREAGLDGMNKRAEGVGALRDSGRGSERANTHTTVKPVELIRYLAGLILPPPRDTPRRILVPFSGVSSEMIGCLQAGWDEVVGIEQKTEYIEIAKTRLAKGGVFSGLLDKRMRKKRERTER